MAAGVSLPALALQVTLSDAILYPSGTGRCQRSSGTEWGTYAVSRDLAVGSTGLPGPGGELRLRPETWKGLG